MQHGRQGGHRTGHHKGAAPGRKAGVHGCTVSPLHSPHGQCTRHPQGQPLSGLLPFLRPYRARLALAGLFLVLAAVATLLFPLALRGLIDGGLVSAGQDDKGAQVMALREHFLALFGVAVALGLFSARRAFMPSAGWASASRPTCAMRSTAHVLRQSPEFFETTQTGEVLSRLTTDTTLVQTVVGSSLSMGLRNAVMGIGALAMLVWTNPYVMTQVLLIMCWWCCPPCGLAGACASSRAPARTAWPIPAPSRPRC
jgi:ABC-type multidrug transport system fused ATPase/permease subunit